MNPSKHILYGFIFSVIIYLIFPKIKIIGFLLIFLSSFLIDTDHYIYYVYRKKDINPISSYRAHIKRKNKILSWKKEQRRKYYGGLMFFHGIEIVILFLILSYFSIYFLYIAIGISFHLVLDIIYSIHFTGRIDRFSLIWDIYKTKKLKYLPYQKL